MTSLGLYKRWLSTFALIAALSTLTTCYDPNVLDGQFTCSASDQRCPAGFICDLGSNLCVRPGNERDAAVFIPDGFCAPTCALCCQGTCCNAGEICAPEPMVSCCAPTTPDVPDDDFLDRNCDGIVGDIQDAVFVDPTDGDDLADGSMATPKKHLGGAQGALAAAITLNRHQILLASGTLNESSTLDFPEHIGGLGYGIFGGYSNTWIRNQTNPSPQIEGAAMAVRFSQLQSAVIWDRVDVAATTGVGSGGSSYGMFIVSSADRLTVRHSLIKARAGAGGASGAAGTSVPNGPPGSASSGSCSCSSPATPCPFNCTSCTAAPGGAAPTCLAGAGFAGGAAGCPSHSGQHGAGPASGTEGAPGTDHAIIPSHPAGYPGRAGTAGNPGNGGASLGQILLGGYVGADGSSGTSNGSNGSGGGGATDIGLILCSGACPGSFPAITGSGGAGGCGGRPGMGGRGGGASVAVYLWDSSPTFVSTSFYSANGGTGGQGGLGSFGQGGAGGNSTYSGGKGGNGGQGGRGGGGGGGPSFGLMKNNASTPTLQDPVWNIGQGGVGGAGGNTGANGLSGNTN